MLTASVACSSTPRPGSADFARDHEAHSFAIAANLSVVEEGQLAGGRGTREEVRVLGQHLMADHARALASHNDMSTIFQTDWGLNTPDGKDLKYIRGDIGRTRALPAPPAPSDVVYTINRAALDASPAATDVMRNHEEGLTALKAADGAAFDRMFLERQITLHRYLIDKIDQMLPHVTTKVLREQLEQDRMTLETHLRMAESILQ
jgi:predicted outer membrane protein